MATDVATGIPAGPPAVAAPFVRLSTPSDREGVADGPSVEARRSASGTLPRPATLLGAARLGYGRCRGCGRPRRIFVALLVTGAPRGCRRCVALAVMVSRHLTEWRRLARACQTADRARAEARARKAVA